MKSVLNDLGHYEAPDWGVTPYPDNELFKGIKSFQRTHGLKIDGIMNPGGETQQTLSGVVQSTVAKSDKLTQTQNRNSKQDDGVQLAAMAGAPAIPWIATQVPGWAAGVTGMLGLTLPLGSDTPRDDNCDHQLYNVDIPTCIGIKKQRGSAAAQRCFSSANARYAACLAGKPRDQWPPLDTWNN